MPRLAERRYRLTWWALTRGFVLLVAAGMMLHHDWKHIFDDLNVYSGWGEGLAEGRVPSDDPMWQYPPLAAFVFGAIGLLGSQPWLFALLFVMTGLVNQFNLEPVEAIEQFGADQWVLPEGDSWVMMQHTMAAPLSVLPT